MVTVEPCDSLVFGSPAFHSIMLILVLTWSPRGWAGSHYGVQAPACIWCVAGLDGSLHTQLTLAPTWTCWQEARVPSIGAKCRLEGLVHSRPTSISMCEAAFSLNLQGSNLPLKDDLYFSLLYLDKHWRNWSCYIYLEEISELIYLVSWNLLLLSIYS